MEHKAFKELIAGKNKEQLSEYVGSTKIVTDFAAKMEIAANNNLLRTAAAKVVDEKYRGNEMSPDERKRMIAAVKVKDPVFHKLTDGKENKDLRNLLDSGNFVKAYENTARNLANSRKKEQEKVLPSKNNAREF